MIVISDTTPIISLMKTGQLELLGKLFEVVCIPSAVYRELTENEEYQEADEKQSDVLLMDEHRGRQVAKRMGIVITSTIGILAQAFDEGLLAKECVEECIEKMKESDIRISEKLYQELRKHVERIQ